jgi:hypothetical protein
MEFGEIYLSNLFFILFRKIFFLIFYLLLFVESKCFMTDLSLYKKINALPKPMKKEILDYLDFLVLKKYQKNILSINHPKAGCMKGIFILSPDFDEPLDDFKDYMI